MSVHLWYRHNELVETEEYGWIQPGWKEKLKKTIKILQKIQVQSKTS